MLFVVIGVSVIGLFLLYKWLRSSGNEAALETRIEGLNLIVGNLTSRVVAYEQAEVAKVEAVTKKIETTLVADAEKIGTAVKTEIEKVL